MTEPGKDALTVLILVAIGLVSWAIETFLGRWKR